MAPFKTGHYRSYLGQQRQKKKITISTWKHNDCSGAELAFKHYGPTCFLTTADGTREPRTSCQSPTCCYCLRAASLPSLQEGSHQHTLIQPWLHWSCSGEGKLGVLLPDSSQARLTAQVLPQEHKNLSPTLSSMKQSPPSTAIADLLRSSPTTQIVLLLLQAGNALPGKNGILLAPKSLIFTDSNASILLVMS